MSNSPLVSYTKISPNKTSPRNHKIDTITIHCVVGQVTVERLGDIFAPESRKASSNYGVGKDGRIGMYVEEKDRSWCSSNSANDNRAITIEVASDTKDPYAITDAAYKGLIDLLVDICQRNDIKELKWKADKSLIGKPEEQNMTVHRWFANKSCPGDYLYERHGQIAAEVNARLGVSTSVTPTTPITPAEPKPDEPVSTHGIKPGSIVKIKAGATYYDGSDIPAWVGTKQWIVKDVDGDRIVIDKSVDGKNSINSPIHTKFLTVVSSDKAETSKEFKVKVGIPNLNIRKGPGMNYDTHGRFTGVGVFTIVEVKTGNGSTSGWGLLKAYEKSRNGWISLDYTKRV
jgi:hypothetical protein